MSTQRSISITIKRGKGAELVKKCPILLDFGPKTQLFLLLAEGPLRTSNPRKPRANARGFFVPIESAQACLGRGRRAQKTAPPQECVAFWGCEQPLSRHRRPQGGNPSSAHQGAYGNAKQHYSTSTFNSTRGERHGSVEDIFQL